MKIKFVATVFVSGVMFYSNAVFSWGQFGHQQVNSAAIDLLDSKTAIGSCLQTDAAKKLMLRYAITPDLEWKMDLKMTNLSHEDFMNRKDNDCYEHPLHFFEADAFFKPSESGSISKDLPTDSDYANSAYPQYVTLFKGNVEYSNVLDPDKKIEDVNHIKVFDLASHGTAPWRVLGLYRAAVEAMKNQDFASAALYLGTMGHYVGDMGQPFHTTLNFNGQYPEDAHQAGIHSEVDTKIFDLLYTNKQKKNKTIKDENSVFHVFEGVNFTVRDEASQLRNDINSQTRTLLSKNPGPIAEEDVVPQVFNLIKSGYPHIPSLLKIYKEQCDAANSTPSSRRSANNKPRAVKCLQVDGKVKAYLSKAYELRFRDAKINDQMTVYQLIQSRLASSAALLNKLWISAWNDAGKPDFGNCAQWKFDQSYVFAKYLKPDYYPHSFNGATRCSKARQNIEDDEGDGAQNDREPNSVKKGRKPANTCKAR